MKNITSRLALIATAALIDWKFSITKPSRITADTAIDSLTHLIEAFISKKVSNFSAALALKAIQLITKNIEKAFYRPCDPVATEALILGVTLAGMAFSYLSFELAHGMSRPMEAHLHITHGLSNPLLLTEVTKFSIKFSENRHAKCAVAAG